MKSCRLCTVHCQVFPAQMYGLSSTIIPLSSVVVFMLSRALPYMQLYICPYVTLLQLNFYTRVISLHVWSRQHAVQVEERNLISSYDMCVRSTHTVAHTAVYIAIIYTAILQLACQMANFGFRILYQLSAITTVRYPQSGFQALPWQPRALQQCTRGGLS